MSSAAKRPTHPLAGKIVRISGQRTFLVEDWWINVSGKPWYESHGNPACLQYAGNVLINKLPNDDEVVYGHVRGEFGALLHDSQLGEALV